MNKIQYIRVYAINKLLQAQVDELSARKLADLVSLVNDGADIGELSKDIDVRLNLFEKIKNNI